MLCLVYCTICHRMVVFAKQASKDIQEIVSISKEHEIEHYASPGRGCFILMNYITSRCLFVARNS